LPPKKWTRLSADSVRASKPHGPEDGKDRLVEQSLGEALRSAKESIGLHTGAWACMILACVFSSRPPAHPRLAVYATCLGPERIRRRRAVNETLASARIVAQNSERRIFFGTVPAPLYIPLSINLPPTVYRQCHWYGE